MGSGRYKNDLPDRTCEAKKILRSMSMIDEKIHACPNDCIFYRKEYGHLEKSPVCGRSRYKTNDKVSSKVLWCFPIIPKFKHMFKNAECAKSLTSHSNGWIIDNMLRHSADSPQ